MKAIIAGGRDFKPTPEQYFWLQKIAYRYNIHEVVSGGCTGADAFGEQFSSFENLKITIFKADWKTHGKSAGPIRNAEMAKYADLCILFPGGAGTRSMEKIAEQHKLYIEKWESE